MELAEEHYIQFQKTSIIMQIKKLDKIHENAKEAKNKYTKNGKEQL